MFCNVTKKDIINGLNKKSDRQLHLFQDVSRSSLTEFKRDLEKTMGSKTVHIIVVEE